MSQSPSASLLRLREADVVRLCGLIAAARGLEIVAHHGVRQRRRMVNRLTASVIEQATESSEATTQPNASPWIEAAEDAASPIRWQCACQAAPPVLACEHVAALLTAWIRDPASFTTPPETADLTATTRNAAQAPDSASSPASAVSASQHSVTRLSSQPIHSPHLSQPTLLRASRSLHPQHQATLAEELERLSASDLLALTRRILGVEDTSPQAHRLLALRLSEPQHLRELIGRLDAEAQTFLAELCLLGGSCTSADLDAIAVRCGQATSALRATIATLERYALVFPAPGLVPVESRPTALPFDSTVSVSPRSSQSYQPHHPQHPWRHVAGWRVPSEIRIAWSPGLPIAAAPTRTPQGPPLLEVPANATDASSRTAKVARIVTASPRQLLLALALLTHAPAPYNPFLATSRTTARISSTNASQQRPVVHSPAFPLVPGDLSFALASEFARNAGIPVGLAQMARRLLLWAREQEETSALVLDMPRLPVAERMQALIRAFPIWQQTELPFELADLPLLSSSIRAQFDQRHEALRPAAVAADVYAARKFLLTVLRQAEPGTWYSLDALLALLWRINPFFLRGHQQTYTTPAWWLERQGQNRPLRASVREEWYAAEGEYLRCWLAGPLHWWGACDLATAPSGQAIAFRLTPWGASLLGPPPADASMSALPATLFADADWGMSVLGTRTDGLAVQPLAAGAALLDALALWMRPTAVAGGRLIYSFDADRASASFDQQFTPEHLLSLLRQADTSAGQRVMSMAETQFVAWVARYGASRVTSGWTLIEARDEATLSEALAALPETLISQCRRLAPAQLLVPPAITDDVAAILQRRGYHV